MVTATPTRAFERERLSVEVFDSGEGLAVAAAALVERELQAAIERSGRANLVLATGASQFSFLAELQKAEVDWPKVRAFHLDEYTELPDDHPASFRRYLRERILDAVRPGHVHLLAGDAPNLEETMMEYSSLLRAHPIDVACIGIGENGHIAFNDPPVADFDDPLLVKEVELDEACRRQQVDEGWFPSMEEAPRRAVTLTIPAVMSSAVISCVVPGPRKAAAVQAALDGPIDVACPASILRRHERATLFLDVHSAARV